MMVWQATGFHFKIYAFILEKECYSHYDATKINQSGDEETLCNILMHNFMLICVQKATAHFSL